MQDYSLCVICATLVNTQTDSFSPVCLLAQPTEVKKHSDVF